MALVRIRESPSGPFREFETGGECTPLSTLKFVDGGTTVPPADRDGAACSPFSTLGAALASPALALAVQATPTTYAESLAVGAGVQVRLYGAGATLLGNQTVGIGARLELDGWEVLGNVAAAATARLVARNTIVAGEIASPDADVSLFGCRVTGQELLARELEAYDCHFDLSAGIPRAFLLSGTRALFRNCTFAGPAVPMNIEFTAPGGVVDMDAASWANWRAVNESSTVANGIWRNADRAPVVDHGDMGSGEAIDVISGQDHVGTLTENCVLSFVAIVDRGWSLNLTLTQGGAGGFNVTGNVLWTGGTPPVLTAAPGSVDVLTFYSPNGTTIYGGLALPNCG